VTTKTETPAKAPQDNGSEPEAAGVYAKLAAVYREISTVDQSGKNNHLNYEYSTDSDLYKVIRPLLAKHKLLLAPTVHSVEGDGQNAVVTIHFRWIDTEDTVGTHDKAPLTPLGIHTDSWVSAGKDNGGFAISKALTTGIRTYLAKFFQIPTGDIDPEAEHGKTDASSGPKLDGELVDDIVSLSRYLIDSNIWTKEHLKLQFVQAGASDTSSSSAAAASLSHKDALAFKKALEAAGK
jgi:hypothetical protein